MKRVARSSRTISRWRSSSGSSSGIGAGARRDDRALHAPPPRPAESRVDRSTSAPGFAAASSLQNAAAGQSTQALYSAIRAFQSTGSSANRGMPHRDVGGPLEHLEHVVAATAQELLERTLQRCGAGPPQSRAHHPQHATSPRPVCQARDASKPTSSPSVHALARGGATQRFSLRLLRRCVLEGAATAGQARQ